MPTWKCSNCTSFPDRIVRITVIPFTKCGLQVVAVLEKCEVKQKCYTETDSSIAGQEMATSPRTRGLI
jgi:hypothetical protein